MIRSQDKTIARMQDAHIARELGISIETLGLHPFKLIDAGLGHPSPRWRLLWQTSPPDSVPCYGSGAFTWSEISAMPAELDGRKTTNG